MLRIQILARMETEVIEIAREIFNLLGEAGIRLLTDKKLVISGIPMSVSNDKVVNIISADGEERKSMRSKLEGMSKTISGLRILSRSK